MISVKTDRILKNEAQKTASELGMPLGTVINAFLRQFVRDREITVSVAHKPSASLRKAIAEAERDLVSGKNISPEFSSAKDAIAYLRSGRV